ncbi:MAG: imelysin family protein [Marinibacterium sp.]|nr:imelysin family protein [Marinibacterium sp.]
MRIAALALALLIPGIAGATDVTPLVDDHILPGYRDLAADSAALAQVAQADCQPDSPDLRAAFGAAFDDWVRVSHLLFGPSETEDRAFALAFWPDPRGSTPKALATLIRDEDPAAQDLADFAEVSIAARGFYALEFLLYDPQLAVPGPYHCALVQVISADIAALTADILQGWEDGYADLMRGAGSNDTYRSTIEAQRQLFTALSTGLEFTAQTRLGRPLGTFDKPRPQRAEARRSARSLRHVILSLEATRDLAAGLSEHDPALDAAFATALDRARSLDDPDFAGAADPIKRFRIEVLQQDVNAIRQILAEDLGPRLGIAAGFNSLDGD